MRFAGSRPYPIGSSRGVARPASLAAAMEFLKVLARPPSSQIIISHIYQVHDFRRAGRGIARLG